MQYRTGNPFYARIYGGVFGLCFIIIFLINRLHELSVFLGILTAFHGASCALFGIPVVFVVLRNRLIRYIEVGEW